MKTARQQQIEQEASKLVWDVGMNRAHQYAVDKVLAIETSDEPLIEPNEQLAFWCEVRDLLADWKRELAAMRAEGR